MDVCDLCLQIPNPLFDLAGITCGHFLVPFWTFFGATLIGKAVVKMHIQKFFVILAFNEDLISSAVSLVSRVPMVGAALESPVRDFLAKQKEKLHRKAGQEATAAAATDVRLICHIKIFKTFFSAYLEEFFFFWVRTRTFSHGSLRRSSY